MTSSNENQQARTQEELKKDWERAQKEPCSDTAMVSGFNYLLQYFPRTPKAVFRQIANEIRLKRLTRARFSNIVYYIVKNYQYPQLTVAAWFKMADESRYGQPVR
jgi:hypothetical protein